MLSAHSLQVQFQYPNVLSLTSENGFSGVINSFYTVRQNMFLSMFSIKFVVKCAAKF